MGQGKRRLIPGIAIPIGFRIQKTLIQMPPQYSDEASHESHFLGRSTAFGDGRRYRHHAQALAVDTSRTEATLATLAGIIHADSDDTLAFTPTAIRCASTA
jgi:hypothetical protein